MQWSSFNAILSLSIISAIVSIVYYPVWNDKTIWEWHNLWDDGANFLRPHQQQGMHGVLKRCWSSRDLAVWEPVSCMAKAVQATLFGLDQGPKNFLRVSLALHTLNTWLIANVALRVEELQLCNKRKPRYFWTGAHVVSLIGVGIHPLRVECVCWASAQPYLLSSSFGLIGLLSIIPEPNYTMPSSPFWKKIRIACRNTGALLCLVAAVFAKGAAVTVPAVIILVDSLCLARECRLEGIETTYIVRRFMRGLVLIILMVFAVYCASWASNLSEKKLSLGLGGLERLTRASFTVVYFHVSKLLHPCRLANLYPLPFEGFGLNMISNCYALIANTFFAIVSLNGLKNWIFAGEKKGTLYRLLTGGSFAWCLFGVLLAPTLGGMLFLKAEHGYPSISADRYSYLASMAFVPFCSAYVRRSLALPPTNIRRRVLYIGLRSTLSLLTIVLLVSSRMNCVRWRNDVTLWSRMIATDTKNVIAFANLRKALANSSSKDTSTALLREAWKVTHLAVQYNPVYTKKPENIAAAFLKSAKTLASSGLTAEAVEAYILAGKQNHSDAAIWVSIANGLSSSGDLYGAAEAYKRITSLLPGNAAVQCNYAELLLGLSVNSPDRKAESISELSVCVVLLRSKFGSQDARTKEALWRLRGLENGDI